MNQAHVDLAVAANLAAAYLRMPIPNISKLGEGLDFVEQELRREGTDSAELYRFVDALTDTMGFRASSAEICEDVLHDRGDQLRRIIELAANTNSEGFLRVPVEFIRGAYAAIDYTRTNRPGRELYTRISGWRYDETDEGTRAASIVNLRGLLDEVLLDVAQAVEKRKRPPIPDVP